MDSRHLSADPEELECQRSARTQTLLNPVLIEFPGAHASKRISRQPPQARTLGSSALPPTVPPDAYREQRFASSSGKILGTSITCSGSGVNVLERCMMSGNRYPICGTGASRICTVGAKCTKSTMCSTVCRGTLSCGRGCVTDPSRTPPSASSSSNNWKHAWGGGGFCRRNALCSSCPSFPALATF